MPSRRSDDLRDAATHLPRADDEDVLELHGKTLTAAITKAEVRPLRGQTHQGRSVSRREARLTRRRTDATRARAACGRRTKGDSREPAKSARAQPARVPREAAK